MSGANARFTRKAKGLQTKVDFVRSVDSPYGKRRVQCHLIIIESY